MEPSPIAEIGVTVITGGYGATTGWWGMSWQLWVLIAAAASGVAAILLVKLSQAQEVFERIVETGPRSRPERPDLSVDDLIRYRRRQEPRPTWFFQTAHPDHRTRGHH
jgi:hypothetical protein